MGSHVVIKVNVSADILRCVGSLTSVMSVHMYPDVGGEQQDPPKRRCTRARLASATFRMKISRVFEGFRQVVKEIFALLMSCGA